MTTRPIDTILEQAARLSAEERAEIADRLLASLDPPGTSQGDQDHAAIDRLWADEAERRLAAYLAGNVVARDADDVLAKYLTP